MAQDVGKKGSQVDEKLVKIETDSVADLSLFSEQ